MSHVVAAQVLPDEILHAFGRYQIGFSQASVGDGGPDDGRFQDIQTDWAREPVVILRDRWLRELVRRTTKGRYNFMELWGWPEVRYRDDGCGMVYGRLRLMYVQVIFQPRPN